MVPGKLIVPCLFMILCLPGVAGAEDPASRGSRIVDEWCRTCHLRVTDSPDPDMAPPYEDIVRRPGRDRAYFIRFLQEDHFPMTIYRLFEHEKADVVAYLLGLQGKITDGQ